MNFAATFSAYRGGLFSRDIPVEAPAGFYRWLVDTEAAGKARVIDRRGAGYLMKFMMTVKLPFRFCAEKERARASSVTAISGGTYPQLYPPRRTL